MHTTHRASALALCIWGLAGCYEVDSPLLTDSGTDDTANGGGSAADCRAEDTFGAVVCDQYFTPEEVSGAVTIGWIDLDEQIEKLVLDDIDIREGSESWQEWSLEVTTRSTTSGGNPVLGITVPGAPERDGDVDIKGEAQTVDGEWIDICDLETGVIVHIDGVEFTEHRCGTHFDMDW